MKPSPKPRKKPSAPCWTILAFRCRRACRSRFPTVACPMPQVPNGPPGTGPRRASSMACERKPESGTGTRPLLPGSVASPTRWPTTRSTGCSSKHHTARAYADAGSFRLCDEEPDCRHARRSYFPCLRCHRALCPAFSMANAFSASLERCPPGSTPEPRPKPTCIFGRINRCPGPARSGRRRRCGAAQAPCAALHSARRCGRFLAPRPEPRHAENLGPC